MSIAVPLEDLADRLQEHPWGYLVTVRDDGRAQTLAVPTRLVDGALIAAVGRSTAANVVARSNVTMVFPGADGEAFSLIVDGDAALDTTDTGGDGAQVVVTPTWAVLHRPALGRD